jgi:hypothetical protein
LFLAEDSGAREHCPRQASRWRVALVRLSSFTMTGGRLYGPSGELSLPCLDGRLPVAPGA